MYSKKVFKIIFLPSAAVVVEQSIKNYGEKKVCRPSELPLYTPPETPIVQEQKTRLPNSFEEYFATARQHVTKVYQEVKAYQRVGVDYLEQSKDNAEWLLKYLRQEDNTTPKVGAIAIGGLTGLIFGLRGGFFKKTIYATTGALGMASLCYPKEATEYSEVALTEARKYATIAYNFAYGVKKDDPPLELPSFPHIPSISEAWDSVTKSASSLVSGEEPLKQATPAPNSK